MSLRDRVLAETAAGKRAAGATQRASNLLANSNLINDTPTTRVSLKDRVLAKASNSQQRFQSPDFMSSFIGPDRTTFAQRYITEPFGRGIDRFQGLLALSVGDFDEFAAQQQEIDSSVQLTPEDQEDMRRINETDSLFEALTIYATNPRLIANIASESLGLFLPTLGTAAVAGATGGVGAAALATGLGSAATEFLATIEGEAVERGADPKDVRQMDALLASDEFLKAATQKGLERGIPIGVLDALSIGVAGKLVTAPARDAAGKIVRGAPRTARGLGGSLTGSVGELGVQGVLGGAGEAAAQIASEGRITSPGEIASEIVGEFGTGPTEVATAIMSRRRGRQAAPPPDTETPPADVPPPVETTTSPPDPEAISALAAENRRRYERGLERQGTLEGFEAAPAAEVEPGRGRRADDVQGRYQRGLAATRQGQLGFEEEPTTEVAEVEAEVSPPAATAAAEPIEQAEVPVLVNPVQRWIDTQETITKTEGGRTVTRQKPVSKDDTTGTKATPNRILRDALIAVREAAVDRGFINAEDVTTLTKSHTKPQQIIDHFDSLVEALRTKRPDLADQLSASILDPDVRNTSEDLSFIEAAIRSDVDPTIAGSPLENIKTQSARARIKADKRFKEGIKTEGRAQLRADRADVQNMLAATVALFERLSGITIARRTTESVESEVEGGVETIRKLQPIKLKDLTKKLAKQPKYLAKTGNELTEAMRTMYGARDASAKAIRRVYGMLDKVEAELQKRGGAKFEERAQQLEQIGRERRLAEVPEVDQTPAPTIRKSEPAAGTAEFVQENKRRRAEQREAAQVRAMAQQPVPNQIEPAEQEKAAGKAPPKEVTEPSPPTKELKAQKPKKGRGPKKKQTKLKSRVGPTPTEKEAFEKRQRELPTPPTTQEVAASVGRTASLQAEQRAEARAQREAEAEQAAAEAAERAEAEAKKVRVRPRQARSTRAIMKILRIGSEGKLRALGGAGILSDLPFFRGMLTREASELTQDARFAANFRESLSAQDRAEFDALIDTFINEPAPQVAAGEPTPRVVGTANYFDIIAEVAPRENVGVQGFSEPGATPTAPQAILNELLEFVNERVRNANEVRPAVREYALSLRTLQRRGFNVGTIVLESRAAELARDAALQEQLGNSFKQNWRKASTTQEMLDLLIDSLPDNHYLHALALSLKQSGVDVPISLELPIPDSPLGERSGLFVFDIPAGTRNIYLADDMRSGEAARVALHEMTHVVTALGYRLDPKVRLFIDNLYAEAVIDAQRRGFNHPGLQTQEEFISEAFTDDTFRQFLSETPTGIWRRLVAAVRRWLGLENKVEESVLDSIMKAQPQLINTEAQIQSLLDRAQNLPAFQLAKIPDGAQALKQADSFARRWSEKARTALRAGNFGFMDLNYMGLRFRDVIKTAMAAAKLGEGNPLMNVINAVVATTRSARLLQNDFQATAEIVQALDEQSRINLGTAMEVITRARFDPNKPYDANNQPWLFDAKGNPLRDELVNKAINAWKGLNSQEQTALNALRTLTAEARRYRREALLHHALERRFPDLDADTLEVLSTAPDAATFSTLVDDNVETTEGMTLDQVKILGNEVFDMAEIQGTYFPLRRKGNYVVVIEDDNPEQAYFAAFDTEFEANQHKAELVKKGENAEDIRVTPFITPGGQSTGLLDAARQLTSRLTKDSLVKNDDNSLDEKDVAKLNDAVVRAMAEIMSDKLLSSAQLRRENVPGAQPLQMLSNVEDYVRASISAVSMLETANTYDKALADMGRLQSDPNVDADSRRTIAAIRNELLLRAGEIASDRDVVATDRILGSVGFYNFLGAPSYWILNATQTAVVGIPVLAGLTNTSYLRSMQSWKKAMKTLHDATKGLGFKALKDLDAVLGRLTPEQQAVVKQLVQDNVIEGTLTHEFNLMLKSDNSTYSKVTDLLTTAPEMVERWNRIAMALAAMDTGLTMDNYQAIKDIVESSQFNYDPSNRARLLKYAPKFLGGGARRFIAPMMMFKVFGVNMARLVYGNLYDAILGGRNRNLSKEERIAAFKVFAGLIGSHTAFGGVFGGLGLGMAQIVQSAVNAILDDDDEIDAARALEDFLIAHTNEYIARIVTRGAPAALGVDMSASINLGNLLFMNRDTDWSRFGGVEQSVYALMGPVAQYAAGALREGSQFMDGEASAAEFLEKAVPLKLYRGLSQAFRQQFEGLDTSQGQQYLSPDELNLGNFVIGALGLRPAVVSQRQDRFYADRTFNRAMESRKSRLMSDWRQADTNADRAEVRKEIREWNALQRRKRNYSLIIRSKSLRRGEDAAREVQRRYNRREFTEYNR